MATFSRALVRGSRLKLWNTKPIFRFLSIARWVDRQLRNILAIEPVLAGSRPVEAAQDVHQRALARAGSTHEGDQLAPGNGQAILP